MSVIKLPMWHASNIVSPRSTICTSSAGLGGGLLWKQTDLQSASPASLPKAAMEFAMVASALKHSIEGDYNMVTISEVGKLFGGAAPVESRGNAAFRFKRRV